MNNSQKIAVIGFGYWGKNLIRNFNSLGVLNLICDKESTRRATADQQYPDVRFCTSPADVWNDDTIEAVAIATPAATHYELAKAALLAGKDVFVEKPLALHVHEAEELAALADERHRMLMVGHILYYHPAIDKLKELIHNGDLGRIEYLYSNRLNIGKFRTEENILWSFAPHDISVVLSLLDEEPCSVTCQGGEFLSETVADVTLSQLRFPSGVQAHIFVSWLHPFKEQRLVVVGSQKMAVMDDTAEDKLVLYPHRVEWVNRIPTAVKAEAEKVPLSVAEPLRVECQHFLDCVANRVRPRTDGREGLRVLKVLEACQNALQETSAFRGGLSRGRQRPAGPQPAATNGYFADDTACIDDGCHIGKGTSIWNFTHVMKGARIGQRCTIGQNCCIAPGVVIGDHVKIQNNVSVYTGTEIEDDVFLGPSCVLTNVTNPRSQVKRSRVYEKTWLRRGATIGANATIVCGVEIGRYAFVAAGAVVTKDVPQYGLVMGAPARHVGWMSRHGHRLDKFDAEGIATCPESGYRYRLDADRALCCLDLDESEPLPDDQVVGQAPYRSFKLKQPKPG